MSAPVKIDGHVYDADMRLFARDLLVSNVALQDQGAEPGEQSLNRFGWKRSQTDFYYGAGEEWFDQEDDNNRQRYYEAHGWHFTERGKLKNSPLSALAGTAAGVTGINKILAGSSSDGTSFWINESDLKTVSGFGATIATVGSYSNAPTDAVVIDGQILVAQGSGNSLERSTEAAPASISSWGTAEPDKLAIASSRLLGFEGNQLYEINGDGDAVAIWTHPSTNFVWKGAVTAPNGVYLWGDDGLNTDIYIMVPTDVAGDFASPYPATPWPKGELVNAMDHYGGVIVIATVRGLRIATIGGSGFLTTGPAMEELGEITSLANDGEYIFGGFTSTLFKTGEVHNGLARFRAAKFTDTLVPAYEVYYTHRDEAVTWTVDSCDIQFRPDTAAGYRYPLMALTNVDDSEQSICYLAPLFNQTSLQFRPGKITYGTPEDKLFMSMEFEFDGTISSVAVSLCVDDTEYDLDVRQGGGPHPSDSRIWRCYGTVPLRGHTFDPRVTVTVPPGASAVEIERWTVRSLVLPEQIEVIELGIIIDNETEDGRGRSLNDSFRQWSRLHDLAKKKTIVDLEVGQRKDRGFIDAFIAPQGEQKDEFDRSESGTFLQGVWLLRFIAADDAPF